MDCDDGKIILKDLSRIETAIDTDESCILFVAFIFKDGSVKKIGKEDKDFEAGRIITLEFKDGEKLLGAEFHHSGDCMEGVTWVKWLPVRKTSMSMML